MSGLDPVELTAKLVRCASVTPANEGALEILEGVLTEAGFVCAWADRGGIRNLFARWGTKGNGKAFGFNGHTDVVPIGNPDDWTMPPFGAEIKDGIMYGRGTTDMKSGVAAFVAAAVDFVRDTPPDGSVVITITCDEEGRMRPDALQEAISRARDDGKKQSALLSALASYMCPPSVQA